jgi:1,2-diacylglycerol 3-alpha-glucosyltransferase
VRPDNFSGIELRSWENIVIVPPDDAKAVAEAIVRLLDDRNLARRIGDAQRQLILDNFSLDAVTDRHLELYESLGRG